MRAAAISYVVVVSAATAAGAWFGADRAVRWFEDSTTSAIRASLDASEDHWAEIEADGLRVILSGTATSEGARARAFESAARLVDTSRIEETIEVIADLSLDVPEFTLEILRSGADLSLIGLLPGANARVTVLNGFGELSETDSVTDLMEAVEFDAPTGWQDALEFGIGAARELSQSRIVVVPAAVSVEAFLENQEDVAATEKILHDRLPKSTALSLDLIAPKPVMAPFRFAASAKQGQVEVTECGSESEAGLILIQNVLKEVGIDEPECTLALGAPSPRWSEAVVASVEALIATGEGRVEISDTDIMLEGYEGVSVADFDGIANRLKAKLPSMFSFSPVAPPIPASEAEPAPPPPSFDALLAEDGAFTMVGLVNDEASKTAVENFAAARFGGAAVTSNLVVDPRVPDGWSSRIFVVLDILAMTVSGAANLSPGRLNVSGTTHEESFDERAKTALDERLKGFETAFDVAFEPREEDPLVAPSARECEKQLASILGRGQIVFAPSSSEITEESEVILDEIAFVIQSCEAALFEIGGHTDSQGRESMNLSLSQSRADALRDSLISRGILPDLLVARGYGESQPIAQNNNETGRAENRRIEFKLLSIPGEAELIETSVQAEPEDELPVVRELQKVKPSKQANGDDASATSHQRLRVFVPPQRQALTTQEETTDDEQN